MDFGRYRIPHIGPASEELSASAALQASARGYRQSRRLVLDDAPARDLFESIEPNSTAELTGLGIGRPQATETVNLSHFPYREDLAYGWPDDAVRFRDQALPFDGHRLLYGHTHQLSPEGARHEALNVGLDAWNLQPVSETQIADWFHAHATDSTRVSPLDMPDSPGPAPIDSAAQQEPGGSVSAAES